MVAVLVAATPMFGQWTADAAANTLASGSAMDIVAALSASDGSTCIVYWTSVGPPTNIELRYQRLDPDGVPMLGAEGMLVSSAIDMSTSTALGTAVMNADDQVYIGVTATGDEEGHVFKIDTDGNHLWPEQGVSFPGGYAITIGPLSTGGAVVSWLNVPNALIQRYDPEGLPVWPEPQPVESGASKTAPGNLFELSNGDVTSVFHTYNFGISSTLWAQRYDGGTGQPVWSSPVQLSNKTTVWNTRYSVGQLGDVVFIGYKAATGLRFDSFLQRIDPDGTIPWGINGSDFDVNETDYEMDTRIALGEGVVWSLCNYKDPGQSENGERIQRFDSETGARQLTDNAKVVYPIGSENVHASDLHLIAGGPCFLMESGYDNGVSNTTLHLVALDGEGDFAWPEEAQPMGLYEASKSRTHLTAPVNGQTVAVWLEDKSTGPAVYAQSFLFEGIPSAVAEGGLDPIPGLMIRPNPTSETLHLSGIFSKAGQVECTVFDAMGRLHWSTQGQIMPGPDCMELDVAHWPEGLYHVKVTCPETQRVEEASFVVRH